MTFEPEDTLTFDVSSIWVDDFLAAPSLDAISQAFAAVNDCDEELVPVEEGAECFAACEVLARLQGNFAFRNEDSAGIDAWVSQNALEVPAELRQAGLSALDRAAGEESALADEWIGEDGWDAAVAGLRAGVATPAS